MPTYEDQTEAKIGDVVIESGHPARYIVFGFDAPSAKLLQIGTVVETNSPWFGKTIIVPRGVTRNVPLSLLVRLGYAEINIVKHASASNAVKIEEQ